MELSHMQTLNDGMYYACHQDEQGSTAYITKDGEAVENSYVYDAFGNVLERKEGIRNDILYRGQQYDQEAGQYYLRARYYNPVIGRFIQEDTYRGDELNLYAYCGNNPVMYYDPSGHTKVTQPITEPEVPRTAGGENTGTVTLYRGDRSSVTPDDVLANGFKPKGTHDDPLLHTSSNANAGNFVSTSSSEEIAIQFAGKNGYVYVIETDNYVDINATYGDMANYPEQLEFSIPGGIKPNEVVGTYKMQSGNIVGDFIPNPNYGGND